MVSPAAVLISPVWSEHTAAQETVTIWHCAICGHEFETSEQCAEPRLSEADLVRTFFPSLLVA